MTRRLSILHLYKTFDPVLGGIEGHVRLVARSQVQRGHDVSVLVTTRGPSRIDIEDGVRVIRCRAFAEIRSMPVSLELFTALREKTFDVVHLQSPFPLGEVAHAVSSRASASVATYQSDIVRQRILGALYRPVLIRLLKRLDRVLVTSQAYLDTSAVLQQLDTDRCCRVVPLGIDVKRFADADHSRVAEIKKKFGPSIVLFVGRLRAYKGLQDLVSAMSRVAETNPRACLVVVGKGAGQPTLERQIAAHGLGHRCRLAGDVEDRELTDLYAAAEVLVLPSRFRSEAFGLVLLEAMAAATPVISTELGTATSWINQHEKTGLVVPPGKPEQLAQAMSTLLSDPSLARRMGRDGRRRVREEFDHRRMVDRIMENYREILR